MSSLDRKEAPSLAVDDDRSLLNSLKNIQEQTSQLNELTLEERRLCKELCELLAHALAFLGSSIDIKPNIFADTVPNIKAVRLNSKAYLIMQRDQGQIEAQSLHETAADLVAEVARDAVPKIEKLATQKCDAIKSRVRFLEKIASELVKAKSILDAGAEEPAVAPFSHEMVNREADVE